MIIEEQPKNNRRTIEEQAAPLPVEVDETVMPLASAVLIFLLVGAIKWALER